MLAWLLDARAVRRQPRDRGPFERHLHEAIALNRERAPRYAALTAGASRRISLGLVTAERLLLPLARRFDAAAGPYHRAGIPLLDALFVSMTDAPPFVAHRACPPDAATPRPTPALTVRREVARAFHRQSFAGARTALESELAARAATPVVDALVRHLLESAHHLASLAPTLIARAEAEGLSSPARLLGQLLRMHLWGLAPAALLDRWARPLQERGIPIIAQDVPPIPVSPMYDAARARHSAPRA